MNSQRVVGNRSIFPLGLGCMNVSWPGGAATDPARLVDSAIAGIHAGLDAGVRLLDTADIYAPAWNEIGHNELFVAHALATWSAPAETKKSVLVATKGGITRADGEVWGRDGSREHLVRAAEASRERLGVNTIQLWQHHRLDASLDFETQVENVGELKSRGIVDRVGVSNYSAQQLRRAIDLLGSPEQGGIVSIQNEFSPLYRHDLDVLEVCEEFGVAFLPWSPLGGSKKVKSLHEPGFRAILEMAENKGVSLEALSLAWLLHYSPMIIPIPGATRADTILDCVSAIDITLTPAEVETFTSALPPSAPRSMELDPTPAFR